MEAKEGMASEREGKRDTEIHRRKNRIQSQAPLWVGVRYHNGLVQALGQEWNVLGSIWARAERKLQEGGSLGQVGEMVSPSVCESGGGSDIQSWWGHEERFM